MGWEMWKETACCQTDSLKNVTSLSRSSQRNRSIPRYPWSMLMYMYAHIYYTYTYIYVHVFLILGRQNSNQMDCPRSNSFSKVHFCQWCLELWNRYVGSCILWGETLLGDDQSGCKYRDSLSPSSWEWNALFSESRLLYCFKIVKKIVTWKI